MRQAGQGIGPKGPHWPQELGKGAEKQHRAPQGPQYQEAPQLAVGPAQQEQEGHGPHGQAVSAVQEAGKAGPAEPEGPQQVIQHPNGQAQQDRLAKSQ